MKKNISTLLILFWFTTISFQVRSQYIYSGSVKDSVTGLGLSGVNISNGSSSSGTITDQDGRFRLKSSSEKLRLHFSRLGYLKRDLDVNAADNQITELGNILLSPAIIGLSEIKIIASSAQDRKTPLTVSTIRASTIERQLGDQPFPEVMKLVPGVYATREGGGSGDAGVNIRGFQQENVALLLNGVPISSVENGLVYWNNWLGLADATRQIQVQKGIGGSNVSTNSVGGTINIITRTTDVEKGGSFKYSMSSYGNSKTTLMLSTGRMKNNMAITFLGSRFSGPGYVDATYVDGWAYFLSISKEFNKKHSLVFTALGNPEKHGQRNFELSSEEIDKYGIKYNKDWGSYDGKINNASENYYHKPFLSLNHYWNISEKSFLATSLYFTYGNGGGKWTETFGDNPWIFNFYNPAAQVDWAKIYDLNSNNTDSFLLANGKDTSGFSNNIQSDYLASHIWTGILSKYQYKLSESLNLNAGMHLRYFHSTLQEKVRDLLGGSFFIDDFAYAVDGVAGREQIKHRGDIVKVDNGSDINTASLFARLEYSRGNLSAFAGGTYTGTWSRREDRYNYVSDTKSEWVSRPGFEIKAGINYNLTEHHNLYLNAGYISNAPYFKFIFANYTNTPTKDLKNEKIKTAELGYGYNSASSRIRLNAYYTLWQDKSVLTNEYNQFQDPSMIRGLDALHTGIEGEIRQDFSDYFSAGGSFSIGSWKWKNNVRAYLYNKENIITDTINVYADGLYVGDAPQTQFGIFGELKAFKLFDINLSWVYYDRLYADFNPNNRTNPDDHSQSYRLPSYSSLDLHLGYPFNIGKLIAYGNISCYNLLNSTYIIRGEDGTGHNLNDFRGFWGFGRNFNFSLKINF